MPVIRHDAIAQNTHKNFGLSFCQGFLERGRVSVISKNSISGIPTVEYVKRHSPQRLTCCFWHTDVNIPRKLPLSTMIWPHPVASTRTSCLYSPDCVTWEYQGHPPGKYAENRIKKFKKTIDKQNLCFYDFLRSVFVARFSGERRTGVRSLLGISRSQISGCKSSGSGTRAAGWPQITRFFPNDWFFPKTGCRCL